MRLDDGALTFAQVGQWFRRIDELATEGRIELGDVSDVDSAGVALLLSAARQARGRGIRLTLVDPPQQLRTLLAFFGVGDLFVSEPAASAP